MLKFKLNNKKIVIGIIILLVGLFDAGLTYYIISRRTSKQLVEEVASAFETLDAMKLKKLTDESIIEYEKSIGDDENIVKKMNSIIVELEGEKLIKMKEIKQIRVVTCQVEECTSSNQIKEIQKSFKDQYGLRVSNYAEISSTWEVISDKKSANIDVFLEVYKKGNKWYLDDYWLD